MSVLPLTSTPHSPASSPHPSAEEGVPSPTLVPVFLSLSHLPFKTWGGHRLPGEGTPCPAQTEKEHPQAAPRAIAFQMWPLRTQLLLQGPSDLQGPDPFGQPSGEPGSGLDALNCTQPPLSKLGRRGGSAQALGQLISSASAASGSSLASGGRCWQTAGVERHSGVAPPTSDWKWVVGGERRNDRELFWHHSYSKSALFRSSSLGLSI